MLPVLDMSAFRTDPHSPAGVHEVWLRLRGPNQWPYGENWLKFRLRSHPDVAAVHHADLVGG